MKKLLITLLLLFTGILSINSQSNNIQKYNTVTFTKANIYNNHYYWDNPYPSNIIITLNLNYDLITIYSPKIQIYKIISKGYTYKDTLNGSNVVFKAKDQDNDICFVRIRISNNINQLYIDYKNIAYCYKIIQIK